MRHRRCVDGSEGPSAISATRSPRHPRGDAGLPSRIRCEHRTAPEACLSLGRSAKSASDARADALIPVLAHAIWIPSGPAAQMPGNRTTPGCPVGRPSATARHMGGRAVNAKPMSTVVTHAHPSRPVREGRCWRLTVKASQCRRSEETLARQRDERGSVSALPVRRPTPTHGRESRCGLLLPGKNGQVGSGDGDHQSG